MSSGVCINKGTEESADYALNLKTTQVQNPDAGCSLQTLFLDFWL